MQLKSKGKTIPVSKFDAALQKAKEAIAKGRAVIYPTDTLYGIGCDATSKKAVGGIYRIKSREPKKPLSILVSDLPMAKKYCEISPRQEQVLTALLPGPYTFLLKLKIPLPVTDSKLVGVRVPEHMFMRTVSRQLGIPIVTTSANRSGGKDAAEIGEIEEGILNSKEVSLIVDGGRCKYAQGSTVIDLVDMRVARKGAVREGDKIEF
jgi:L-threonylcarbamoyladenylate synthase